LELDAVWLVVEGLLLGKKVKVADADGDDAPMGGGGFDAGKFDEGYKRESGEVGIGIG
jgi:hypothetical protein